MGGCIPGASFQTDLQVCKGVNSSRVTLVTIVFSLVSSWDLRFFKKPDPELGPLFKDFVIGVDEIITRN